MKTKVAAAQPLGGAQPTRDGTQPPQDIRTRIALAAYLLAERRGFAPGNDVDDWLAAEAELKEKA